MFFIVPGFIVNIFYMIEFLKNISPTELIIVLLIFVILFGSKVITNLARTSGQSVKEIKKLKEEFSDAINIDDKSKKD